MVTDKKMFNTYIQLHVAFSSLEFANTVSGAYTISSHVITKPFLYYLEHIFYHMGHQEYYNFHSIYLN